MNLKKTWKGENGCTSVITRENGSLKMMAVDMLSLKAGQEHSWDEHGWEYGIIILGGKCDVEGDGFGYAGIGKRADVFDGPATAVYIPAERKFTVRALTDLRAAICKTDGIAGFEPALVKPEDVIIKDLGKNEWQRQAHFIVDERIAAHRIYIGEAYVKGGMWASYPPHKHDEDNMPAEGILEEIYYYEYDRPTGFGIQKVYAADGSLDETYTVKNGDFVEIPIGYHPFCSAPGYTAYYLWIMAGENRGFFMSSDPDHKWMNA